MIYSEENMDSGGRFAQAVALSVAAHAALLGLVIFTSAWTARAPVIRPGDAVFVTPVSPPKESRPVEKPKVEPPPPPPVEEPKLKKPSIPAPVKKLDRGKIVPKGAKIKPPEPVKPPEPKPMEPPPRFDTPPAKAPAPARSFRAEGEEFKYDYYVKIVKRKVEEGWITHGIDATGQKGNPEVYFRINKNGLVTDLRMDKSSGSAELDQSALEAVKSASFPPLPPGYKPDYLGVYYSFDYAKKD